MYNTKYQFLNFWAIYLFLLVTWQLVTNVTQIEYGVLFLFVHKEKQNDAVNHKWVSCIDIAKCFIPVTFEYMSNWNLIH